MLIWHQIALARAPLFVFAAMGVGWGTYAASVPDIKAMLGVNDALFGSLLLATPIAAMAAMLAAPRIAPLLGRHALPMSTAAYALAFALPGQFSDPAFFALAMVLVGASTGLMDVLMNARVAALEASARTHLMNLSHAFYSFGYAGASIVTGFARNGGVSPSQIMVAAALLVAAMALATLEKGEGVNSFGKRPKGASGLGMVPVWGGIIVMVAFMSENAAENWSALHIERTLGGSPAEGSFGPALLALVMGFGRIFGQLVLARADERQVLVAGALVAAAGLALTGLATAPWIAFVGLCVIGLGGAVIAPTAYAVVGRSVPDEARAHALARATLLGYSGYFLGPPMLGMVAQAFGLPMSFVAMALVLLLSQGLIALMFRHIGRQG